jgi:hypothetical protein
MVLNFLPGKKHEQFFIIVAVVAILLVAAVHPTGITAIPTTNKTVVNYFTTDIPLPPVNNSSLPPKNNTTCPAPTNTTPVPCPPQPLRIAVAGDVQFMTPARLDYWKSVGVVEIHIVSPDAQTYPTVLRDIQARGMVPVYDGEMAYWYNRNSASPFTAIELASLKSIYDAGWHNFASEGLYGNQVAQINGLGFHYYNYGGDQGNNLYTENFGHAHGSHWANYEEFYDPVLETKTLNTILYQAKETPTTNGVLYGLWRYVPSGGTCPAFDAAKYVKDFNAKGAKITTVLFWGGLTTDPYAWVGPGGCYYSDFNEVKALRF